MTRLTDEQRWRAVGRSPGMALEQRAEFIASTGKITPGSARWRMLRERALEQLREVAAMPQPERVSQGLGAEHR